MEAQKPYMMSLYEYLGRAAGSELGKEVAEVAVKLRETIERAYADAKASLNQFVSAEKSLFAQKESFKNASINPVNFFEFIVESFNF